MKRRGLVERSVSFLKHLGDAKRMRQRARIVLLVGTAVLMLWISPTTAQMTGGAAFEIGPAQFTGTDTIAIAGDATGTGQTGVVGHAWATTGQNFGVRGITNSTSGIAVNGRATAPFGHTFGVRGITLSAGDATTGLPAFGVFGHATALTGPTTGTGGQSDSNIGTGVFGRATAPSGPTTGTIGLSDSPTGTGVFGETTATSCPTVVFPVSPGQTCAGVVGRSVATSGSTAGVFGTVQSSSISAGVFGQTTGSGSTRANASAGVFGLATAPSGFTAGLVGQINSPDGIAIAGNASNGGLAGLFTGGPVSITCPTAPCLLVNGTGVQVPDLAEDMPVARPVSPGDVVVLAPGQGYGVAPATKAYDTMVAGIVSTAPRVRFGIGKVKAAPVAMVGVVKAKATAMNGAIKYGDLLTTSPVPGRLMRCDAALRCVGAIVGKALDPLAKGEQSILVLLWRQ